MLVPDWPGNLQAFFYSGAFAAFTAAGSTACHRVNPTVLVAACLTGLSSAGDRSRCLPPQDQKSSLRATLFFATPQLRDIVKPLPSHPGQKGWAHELDHIGGGTGRLVLNRAGRRLSVRPLHTRSGTRR